MSSNGELSAAKHAYRALERCRVCGNPELAPVLDLGEQVLTGVFPTAVSQQITRGPLRLVKCVERGESHCGLLQLAHSYPLDEMYGDNYGYRSGLNASMVRHLQSKVAAIRRTCRLASGDLVIDIGSNDSTLLKAYPADAGLDLVGIDPTGAKFREYYPAHVRLIPDFFSAELVSRSLGARKAKVITSISMFYDLESPLDFMMQVRDCLADDGIWVAEQSYMPTMMRVNAYDTVCHEHLEYYGLRQIVWMAKRAGLAVVDVELNDINGGSFSFVAMKEGPACPQPAPRVQALLAEEAGKRLDTLAPYEAFREQVSSHREQLISFVQRVKREGRVLFGYGASTKGNVILQFCGFTSEDIGCFAEVNDEKFGAFTPGSLIPIVSEAEARARHPDYFLVMPWHFRDGIIEREQAFIRSGGRLVFPLPSLCVHPT